MIRHFFDWFDGPGGAPWALGLVILAWLAAGIAQTVHLRRRHERRFRSGR